MSALGNQAALNQLANNLRLVAWLRLKEDRSLLMLVLLVVPGDTLLSQVLCNIEEMQTIPTMDTIKSLVILN